MAEMFTESVVAVIKKIPRGKVATYGQVAALAGSPRAARQVVRILHTQSSKHKLPWHRVINGQGRISLKAGQGYEEQEARLRGEKIIFKIDGSIDMVKYQWQPKL